MTIHFPLVFNPLKPQHMKLVKDIAGSIYPYDDVYVEVSDDFLSEFNVLAEVSNFSIKAVESSEVTSSFRNLIPTYVSIDFNCGSKIASYLRGFNKPTDSEDKTILAVKPLSVVFSSNNYTPFFITEIKVEGVRGYGNGIPQFSFSNVTINGYTFYKTNQPETLEYYKEDYSNE